MLRKGQTQLNVLPSDSTELMMRIDTKRAALI